MNGCSPRPGDLLRSRPLSGPTPEEAGALIALTAGGKLPIELPAGEQHRLMKDGDAVSLRGWCEAAGRVRIGFGACEGTVMPAA